MASECAPSSDDGSLLRKSLQGDLQALAELREKYSALLSAVLIRRGANRTEAADLISDLWGDCVPAADDRPSLLEKFNGGSNLRPWLVTVATHRLYDYKRRQQVHRKSTGSDPGFVPGGFLRNLTTTPFPIRDTSLMGLLRETLEQALEECPRESVLMLRLVYLHGLNQRDIGRMWNWHESKVSRALSNELKSIRRSTLRRIKEKDPWLELTWADFLDLCRTYQFSFL